WGFDLRHAAAAHPAGDAGGNAGGNADHDRDRVDAPIVRQGARIVRQGARRGRRDNLVDSYRVAYILEVLVAERSICARELIIDLFVHVARDIDGARFSQRLNLHRDRHAVAVDVIAVAGRIAEADPKAVSDPLLSAHQALPDHDRAPHGVEGAVEDRDKAIAGMLILDDQAIMLGDRRVDDVVAMPADARARAVLIDGKEAVIVFDVGAQIRCRLAPAAADMPRNVPRNHRGPRTPPPTPLRITGVPDQMTIVIVTPLFGVGLSACSHFPVRSPAQPAPWPNCIPRVTKKGPLRRQQGRLMTERVLSSGACSNMAGRPSG